MYKGETTPTFLTHRAPVSVQNSSGHKYGRLKHTEIHIAIATEEVTSITAIKLTIKISKRGAIDTGALTDLKIG